MALGVHIAEKWNDVTIVDLAEFPVNVTAIAERGGVEVRSPWARRRLVRMPASNDVASTTAPADLVIVSAPASAHDDG
jgi:hypothetical protein